MGALVALIITGRIGNSDPKHLKIFIRDKRP
jgi:hypothetical protein